MARSGPRASRLAGQIQRELAEIIRTQLKDPRVGMVTITDIELSADQSHAKIFFTCLQSGEAEVTRQALVRSAGFLRTRLAQALFTRTVPELHFAYDESVERGMRLSSLIDEAVASDPGDPVE